MNIIYNGTDIFDDIYLNQCVHEAFAEKQADSLVLRFLDSDGIWSDWSPSKGDEVEVSDEDTYTGIMYVHSAKAENGLYTIRALSIPIDATTKSSCSWEGVRLLQIGEEIADQYGLTFESYEVEDQVYPYLVQENETDLGFYSRLCTMEGCEMIVCDGKLIVYDEAAMESTEKQCEIEVGEDGHFSYNDNTAEVYGSCEILSDSFAGSFDGPDDSTAVLRPHGIRITSDAEAARFAKGLLRNANKYARTGVFVKDLQGSVSAASMLDLTTVKANAWNGPVFVYRIRNDYVMNSSTIYFRHILEGY